MQTNAQLTQAERQRYSRHLMLPEIGATGQQRIKDARVLLVGAGGLGSPLALYLSAAGVGTLGIVDEDVVDLTNLQRQVLHDSDSIGEHKVDSAQRRLRELNPHVSVHAHKQRLDSRNADSIIAAYDIVADGSDNFPTRYVVNDACVRAGRPLVYGSVFRFEGQASVFDARRGPCYRCLFPHAPPPGAAPSCNEAGVLGVLPGIIGLIQATETLKLIAQVGESLAGRLLVFDALAMRFRELRLAKDPQCAACGSSTEDLSIDYEQVCEPSSEIDALELKRSLDAREQIALLDVREPVEREIAALQNTHEIPMGELAQRAHELPRDIPIIAYCHSGIRSAEAVRQLHAAGFADARSLRGGIAAWADRIDPAMARY